VTWVEVVTRHYELGIRSSATMMYGHVDQPRTGSGTSGPGRVQDRTGGFTEFVGCRSCTRTRRSTRPYRRAGATCGEPGVHAMARSCCTDGSTKSSVLGEAGDEGSVRCSTGGVNDLAHADGGDDLPDAGSEHGSARNVAQLRAIATAAGRPARQRTTTYSRSDWVFSDDARRTVTSRTPGSIGKRRYGREHSDKQAHLSGSADGSRITRV